MVPFGPAPAGATKRLRRHQRKHQDPGEEHVGGIVQRRNQGRDGGRGGGRGGRVPLQLVGDDAALRAVRSLKNPTSYQGATSPEGAHECRHLARARDRLPAWDRCH